ncbi:hypothetical protein I302_107136 [Kwoniella bestiolae CBS 10118]|uniref:DUF159-domain-containing protein n=1 Tax=Kwoniella bestiolae CBS 10118 TaxID=1296100 RepID=A0AAJ8KC42_9TREE
MCGRYALALSNEELYDSLEARLPRLFENGRPRWERQQDNRGGNYNVAPRQRAPVIRRDPEDGERGMIETMQWGLIPHWTKHPPTGPLNTINARSEGLLDPSSGGMWHALKGYKRCIVPAQGYYEWLKKPSSKIPHFTRLPLSPETTIDHPPLLFFAGLYDIVKYDTREAYPTGNPLPLATYTILTTEPSKDIRWLHDRMPVILTEWDDVRDWLDLGEVRGWREGKDGTGGVLRSHAGLESYPVPTEVGKIGNNSPTFIQPVSERKDGIKSFFSKQQSSPVKPKKEEGSHPSPKQVKTEQVKEEAEGIKSEITPKDEEKGLGDDSNAPNKGDSTADQIGQQNEEEDKEVVKAGKEQETGKRKRSEGEDNGDEEIQEIDKPKRGTGGHQTKVVRKTVDEGDKEQPAITNFFKSPSRPGKTTVPKSGSSKKKKR